MKRTGLSEAAVNMSIFVFIIHYKQTSQTMPRTPKLSNIHFQLTVVDASLYISVGTLFLLLSICLLLVNIPHGLFQSVAGISWFYAFDILMINFACEIKFSASVAKSPETIESNIYTWDRTHGMSLSVYIRLYFGCKAYNTI